MRIGVTFFLRKAPGASIWSSGAMQNCVFLWQLLRQAPGVECAYAINGGDGDAPQPGLMLGGLGLDFVRFEDVKDKVDVLIEAGAQVPRWQVDHVHSRGGKAVAYKFGNAYVIDGERILHDQQPGAVFNGSTFDAVWTNPQHMHTCASYWELTYRAPVRCLPHIWEPTFLEAAIREFPPGLSYGYRPTGSKRRVAIYEPNTSLIKMCTIPMLICEAVHRRRPTALGDITVLCSAHLKEHMTFRRFANHLDIVRDGLASFEHRHKLPYWQAKWADIVVSHQWENGLNYAYYEALWGGYPLVHNSGKLPVGYWYSGFDAEDGANAVIRALDRHDGEAEDYLRRARAYLRTVGIGANLIQHAVALDELTADRKAQAS